MTYGASLNLLESDGRGHAHEHAYGDGEVIDPFDILLLGKPDEERHAEAGDHDDPQRDPVAGERKQLSAARDEVANIRTDICRDQPDKHGGHGEVAKPLELRRLAVLFLLGIALQGVAVLLVEEDGEHHAPHNAEAHEQSNGGEAGCGHLRCGQGLHADSLRCGLCHSGLIVERADNGKAEPRPRRAQTAGQGNDAEQNADARDHGKRGTGDHRGAHLFGVHSDGFACTPCADDEYHADDGDKQDDQPADQIHKRAVQLT